jgi:hypothetical protein
VARTEPLDSMVSVRLSPDVEADLRREAEARQESLSTVIRDRLSRGSKSRPGRTPAADLYPRTVTASASGLSLEGHAGILVPHSSAPRVEFDDPRSKS